ncbi:MAG TPA: amidase [Burkholderiales bacterium]|nr:amidase [Burkholderiales bacterium]
MLGKPLYQLTAAEIVRAISARQTTCEAVTRACLERIRVREPEVEAWQYLDPELALRQARALDASGASGPLLGVPVGMKDIIDTADIPTEYGTPIHRGRRPTLDAACVSLTRRAGGVIMGKTVTTEFANFFPGKTRNPLDPARTPGGSSSGSAAAVGDGMVPLAVGTQTTASTIRPAAFCGCVGYRPTWGDIRCSGVMEAAGSVDTLGLIARSVDDVALYRDVLAGVPHEPLAALEGAALRVGFCRTHFWNECEPYTQAALEECARRLANAGARVEDASLPVQFERMQDAHRWITSFEFVRNRAWEIDHRWDEISSKLREGRIRDGQSCSFERYAAARAYAEECRRAMDDFMRGYDVLLTPAVAGEAPVGLQATGNASFCILWTTLHVPAVTLPLFTGPNGLPIGAQLVARRDHDRGLLAAAQWAMRVYDDQKP